MKSIISDCRQPTPFTTRTPQWAKLLLRPLRLPNHWPHQQIQNRRTPRECLNIPELESMASSDQPDNERDHGSIQHRAQDHSPDTARPSVRMIIPKCTHPGAIVPRHDISQPFEPIDHPRPNGITGRRTRIHDTRLILTLLKPRTRAQCPRALLNSHRTHLQRLRHRTELDPIPCAARRMAGCDPPKGSGPRTSRSRRCPGVANLSPRPTPHAGRVAETNRSSPRSPRL